MQVAVHGQTHGHAGAGFSFLHALLPVLPAQHCRGRGNAGKATCTTQFTR